jgi:hypothetical protein
MWLRRGLERLFIRRKVESFYRVLGGYTFFQLMRSAVELDLFTALRRRGPMTHEEVAAALGLEDRATRVLLLGCTVLGLVKLRRGRYRNSLVAGRYLNRDSATNIVSMVEWQHAINYRPMFHLADALRANHNEGLAAIEGPGTTLFAKLANHPDLETIFHRAMDEQSDNLARMFVEQIDFAGYRRIADVGGGNGAYLIEIARAHPHLHGVVVDLPSVCALATHKIRQAGLADRLGTSPGDCFGNELPRDVVRGSQPAAASQRVRRPARGRLGRDLQHHAGGLEIRPAVQRDRLDLFSRHRDRREPALDLAGVRRLADPCGIPQGRPPSLAPRPRRHHRNQVGSQVDI